MLPPLDSALEANVHTTLASWPLMAGHDAVVTWSRSCTAPEA
jgi:hypothetical protein